MALIFTFNGFLCVGSSLVILIESLTEPFLVGENVIVTVLLELGWMVIEPPPVSDSGGWWPGELTITCNGPEPLLLTVMLALAVALGCAVKFKDFLFTWIRPPPGVGVAVGVAVEVAVAVAVRVGVAVAVAVEVAPVAVAVAVTVAVLVAVAETVGLPLAVAVAVAVLVGVAVRVGVAVAVAVGVAPPGTFNETVSIAKSLQSPLQLVRLKVTLVMLAAVVSSTPMKVASPLTSLVTGNDPREVPPSKAWMLAVN